MMMWARIFRARPVANSSDVPVILTKPDDVSPLSLLALLRPLPDDALRILATGEKEGGVTELRPELGL